jgi:sortase A
VPRVRRRRPLLIVVAVAIFAPSCGGSEPRRAVTAPPPPAAAPAIPPSPGNPWVPTTVPAPIRIPDDPYAPEPVVEIGSIEIPKIGLSTRLFQGVTMHNIDRGPSLWTGSALPGQPGNAVVAGHRVSHGRPFRRIDDLARGDLVTFTVHGTRTTYRVTGSKIVGPQDTWIADQTQAVTATLYACHPPGSVAYRYVVDLELAN